MIPSRFALVALLCVPALTGTATAADPPAGENPYRDGLANAVRKVAGFLKSENKGKDAVTALGPIGPKKKGAATGGVVELDVTIRELLKENKVDVVVEAKWAVTVTYAPAAIPIENGLKTRPGLSIVFAVYYEDGLKGSYSADVAGIEPAVTVLGRSFDAGNEKTTELVDQRVIDANAGKPEISVAANKARATEKSPYAVELVMEGKPVALRNDSGYAIAGLPKEKDFLIRLTNDTEHVTAADVRIDGLSAFVLNTDHKGRSKYTHFVIPPKASITVGWHESDAEMSTLKLTEFPKSVAAKFDQNKVGPRAITVVFAAAWEKGKEPADEPKASRDGDGPRIGRGASREVKTKVVELTVGKPRAAVTIRYEEKR